MLAVGGLLLLPSVAGAGGGHVEVVVGSAGTAGCTGFVVESLNGAVSGCVPFAGAVLGGPEAAAADGSVVFGSPVPFPPCPQAEPCAHIPETGTRTEVVKPNRNAVALDAPAWDENDADASVAADGSRVAFLRPYAQTTTSAIYVVNADGSGLHLVTTNGAYLSAPAISPDGGSIAYWCSSWSPGDPVYPPPRRCGPLPDGSYRRSGLMLMNADGTDKRMIVIGHDPGGPGPLSWSPNGRWLTMDALGVEGGCVIGRCKPQVFAYHTDGSDLFNYLDPSQQVNRWVMHETVTAVDAPQFCGSSSQILYESGNQVYLINRNGTHRHRTALDTAQAGYPACVQRPGGKGLPPTVNVMRVTVPEARTLSYAAAKRRLQRAHFHVGSLKRAFSAGIARGHVIAEYPHAGAHVHRSSKQGPPIKLVLSRGPRP